MQRFANRVREQFQGRPLHVLDVGSAGVNGTYRDLFGFEGVQYVGLDIQAGPNVDFVPGDPYNWAELADESFDVVISGQALEHIEFPWLIFEQIARKLKPQGIACLIAPSRGPEHRHPVDCYRYYSDGLRALAKWSGLKVLECDYIRGASGFQDGSDQWGDCHCILVKEQSAPRARHSSHSKQPARGRASHRSNPLKLPRANYFGFERPEIVQLISERKLRARRILELGCGAGAMAKHLRTLLAPEEYIGVELDPTAAAQARAHLDRIYSADIQSVAPSALGLAASSFDLLIALDVLEHLYNPWDILAEYVELLRPQAHAVLSIPNVGNVSIIQQLARGRWKYESAGLLDVTHLRFFGSEGVTQLVSGAGLDVIHIGAVFNPQPVVKNMQDQGNTVTSGDVTLSNLSRAEVLQLFTYQFLVIGQKKR